MHPLLFSVTFSIFAAVTKAVPYKELDFAPWSSAVRHGIQGVDKLRARGIRDTVGDPYLTCANGPGNEGELVVTTLHDPPHFFLNAGRLYHYVNQTTVLPVNVYPPPTPPSDAYDAQQSIQPSPQRSRTGLHKLKVERKVDGIDGEWFYRGSSLHLSPTKLAPSLKEGQSPKSGVKVIRKGNKLTPMPSQSNEGVFWACEMKRGAEGLWGRELYVDWGGYNMHKRPEPEGCLGFTLHSWGDGVDQRRTEL